jgi:hypothetical protein
MFFTRVTNGEPADMQTETLAQDLRDAARMVSANRTFTIVAILSWAVGVSANTTTFSPLNAVLLRSRRNLNCQGHSGQSCDYKQTSEYLLVEFHNFSFVVHVLLGLAFTSVHVDTSECRPSGSALVARSVCVRTDHGSVVFYEDVLRILG